MESVSVTDTFRSLGGNTMWRTVLKNDCIYLTKEGERPTIKVKIGNKVVTLEKVVWIKVK